MLDTCTFYIKCTNYNLNWLAVQDIDNLGKYNDLVHCQQLFLICASENVFHTCQSLTKIFGWTPECFKQ